MYNFITGLFNGKIKTKLQEELDQILSKKLAVLENNLNFVAVKKLAKILAKNSKKLNYSGGDIMGQNYNSNSNARVWLLQHKTDPVTGSDPNVTICPNPITQS